MELRDIEIFLTLAEELHFGRTAERLHVTTARVSQSIKQQERRVGGLLFERTSRTVRLTELGRQLRDDLSPHYHGLWQSLERAQKSARGGGTLTLGTMGPQSWMIRHIITAFKAANPDARLRHVDVNPCNPLAQLRSGEVDVALLWLPIRESDLTVGPVTHTTTQVLMVASDHPLAAQDSVCREDFADLTFLQTKVPVPAYIEEVFQPFHTPSGRPIRRGPVVNSYDDQLKAVSAGHAVAATVAEAAGFYPWPNLTYLPIRDAPVVRWALVWRTENQTPFIDAVTEVVGDVAGPQGEARVLVRDEVSSATDW